ncbi:MAG: DNA metabolism protein [Coprococcus sp.]|nr:DNA metabolism protein [Coprococcus sp.]
MRRIYVCHDDVTGLFSAIYDAWRERRESGDAGIALRGNIEQQLFCEYVETEEQEKKAVAVERLIKKHLGMEAYGKLYAAALSTDPVKGDAVLGTMLAARRLSDSHKIMDNLTNPSVEKVFELSRRVYNEAHFFKEFLRFKELTSGILFARIDPKSQVVTLIAPHFADRLPLENWVIYDRTHKVFAVHEARKQWALVSGVDVDESRMEDVSEGEQEMRRLWKGFCKTIAIEERKSSQRQRQNLPLWYRVNMTEFQETYS